MARPDLTNEEIRRMAAEEPGSASEYLRLRREELEAERLAARAEDDRERWIRRYVAAGGSPQSAKGAYQEHLNEQALEAARQAEQAAVVAARQRVSRAL